MNGGAWNRRIERAEELARTGSRSGVELLRFYLEVARFQRTVEQEPREEVTT